jgi:polysaccharide chain length determinant protein (PEP-CTERM system associated)
MRQNIVLETIEAEYKSKKSGKPTTVAVAFNLSFEAREPKIVHKVTDTLANLFLEEDLKRREQRVSVTADFFTEELQRLQSEITLQEKKISVFKKKHSRELPSDKNANLAAIARLERSMEQADMRLRLLQEKKLLLNSQLATVKPMAPVMVDGKDIAASPEQRLRDLRYELAHLKTIYSEKHPDIKKIKREIAKLEKEIESSRGSNANIQKVAEKPDNPAYINLKTQISSIDMEINAVQEDRKTLIAEIDVYRRRIENAPYVEKELSALMRNYENLNKKYSEISNKLMNARVAKEMDGKQKGERFIVTSPAYLPEKPTKPNRIAIILLSFLIAIALSSVLSVFQESIDDSIKTTDQLKALTGVPVLTPIYFIKTEHEIRAKRLKRIGWTLILVLFVGAGLFLVDQYIMKLDEVWSIFLERIKMIA